jgi:hypothetical protein
MQSLRSILDRVDAFLEDDLLCRMFEWLPGKPTPMRQRPMTAAAVDSPPTQQERKQLLAFATQIIHCCLAHPGKITDRLVRRVKYSYRSKLSRSAPPRQRDRILPVVLTRSPARFGIRAAATTMQSWPRARIRRYSS